MSDYLFKLNSIYDFRRSVPKWNFSLRTKAYEAARRLRVPHIVDTDRQTGR